MLLPWEPGTWGGGEAFVLEKKCEFAFYTAELDGERELVVLYELVGKD